MIDVEATTTIRRPVADVFAYVTDPTNEPRWHTDVAEASLDGPGPLQSGSVISYRFSRSGGGGSATARVVELRSPSDVTIAVQHGPMGTKPTISYRVEPSGSATRFTRHVAIETSGLSRLLQPLLRRLAARRNAAFVENLRKLLDDAAP